MGKFYRCFTVICSFFFGAVKHCAILEHFFYGTETKKNFFRSCFFRPKFSAEIYYYYFCLQWFGVLGNYVHEVWKFVHFDENDQYY